MDLPHNGDEVLTQRTRARIFSWLAEHRELASTEELSAAVGLHPNGVRRHLERMEEAGLVERSRSTGRRGDRRRRGPGRGASQRLCRSRPLAGPRDTARSQPTAGSREGREGDRPRARAERTAGGSQRGLSPSRRLTRLPARPRTQGQRRLHLQAGKLPLSRDGSRESAHRLRVAQGDHQRPLGGTPPRGPAGRFRTARSRCRRLRRQRLGADRQRRLTPPPLPRSRAGQL